MAGRALGAFVDNCGHSPISTKALHGGHRVQGGAARPPRRFPTVTAPIDNTRRTESQAHDHDRAAAAAAASASAALIASAGSADSVDPASR